MPTFLLDKDYRVFISDEIRQQYNDADAALQTAAEDIAIEEVKSYLGGTYDNSKIFILLNRFEGADTFTTGDYAYTTDDTIYKALTDTPGTDFTVTANWQKTDPRNKLIVSLVVKIALYHMESHINPQFIPEFRVKQYDDAISYLKMIVKGQTNLNLPRIDTTTTVPNTFRISSNPKVTQRW